jgi:hypothetical protein
MVWQVRPDSNAQNTPELHAAEEDPQFNEMRGGKILGDFSLAVFGDFQEGRELLHPEWVPEIFYLRKGPKKFSPIISFRGLFAVQREVVGLIEEFEPGVHQFVPITIAKAGTMDALPAQYSLVNIGQMLHSVILDEKVLRVEYVAGSIFWMQRLGDVPYLFKRSIVLGKHLWRDTGSKSLVFASDAFVQAVEDRNIRGLTKVGHHQEM